MRAAHSILASARRRPIDLVRAVLTATVTTVALAGCALGERPTLVEQPIVEDAAARAVLDRLALADTLTFTATYEITPSLTGEPTSATVIQSGARQRITIGDVEFFTDGSVTRTCVADANCVDGFDDARVSDLSITHAFWGESMAGRLRTDARRTVDQTTQRAEEIAGRPATCADLPLPSLSGVERATYCALDEGLLGRYYGADVSIELTSFSASADDSQLT